MSIYLVFKEDEDGDHLDRIFKSEALAKEYIDKFYFNFMYSIEEWEVFE